MQGLEEELAASRDVIERERLERAASEQARFDQLRAEAEEREAINRAQLADITNALEERRAEAARWREADDQRWTEKQARRAGKAERMETLHDLVNGIIAEREEDRRRQEEERVTAAAKPGIEAVLAAMQQQNNDIASMMASIADTLRTDMDRKHMETLESVRATAAEQVPFNVQRYLDDFSKALSEEVRMLLKEVGKLREEKRALQHEIGCLLTLKSKYGPGGEFEPDWVPPGGAAYCPTECPTVPVAGPEPVSVVEEEPAPKPSAWRNVRTRKKSQRDRERDDPLPAPTAVYPTGPLSSAEYVRPPPTAASWQSWRGNATQVPSPSPPAFEGDEPPVVPVRERSPERFGPTPGGFFGPRPSGGA
ncbi:hypothetical protein B0J17DRAFT_573525 [Rhizoctonia solani]|nr:hypothetical protein B0J17DRAFT_573525 [Rhizoctonia solani]